MFGRATTTLAIGPHILVATVTINRKFSIIGMTDLKRWPVEYQCHACIGHDKATDVDCLASSTAC